MNDDELTKVLQVLTHADHGCQFCVKDLFYYFATVFPEYKEKALEYYRSDWEWWESKHTRIVFIPDTLYEEATL